MRRFEMRSLRSLEQKKGGSSDQGTAQQLEARRSFAGYFLPG